MEGIEMNYSEKLKDRRWKVKRLRILIRDRFKCAICGKVSERNQVHHLKYSGDPWDVDDKDLITLCKYCHYTHHRPDIFEKKLSGLRISEILKISNHA
jgi:5-methylcytosine-specific restriction endonuclease McrA